MDGGGTTDRTVAEAMVRTPTTHPPATTVALARELLDAPHRHLLLIVSAGQLLGTVDRTDLDGVVAEAEPALLVARLSGRTVPPDARLARVHAEMGAAGQRRRAVVDHRGQLLGLLCLKASGSGFCSDDGIAARAAARGQGPPRG